MKISVFICTLAACIAFWADSANAGQVIYVNNVSGKNHFPGTREKPVATLRKGLALLKDGGRLEVINTGIAYSDPYPGVRGRMLLVKASGTADNPVVINGNGAVYTGLAAVPAEYWNADGENIYSVDFWPMATHMRAFTKENFWHDGTQIWFVNGQPGKNCHSLEELKATPYGFWWDKANKKARFHLPQGVKMEDTEIKLPANMGFYVDGNYVRIENFYVVQSWNDGFDTITDYRKGIHYLNCIAIDNCGQGMSGHGGDVVYEDCAAIRCCATGTSNVDKCNSIFIRCVFAGNNFGPGISMIGTGTHKFIDCMIVDNTPDVLIHQHTLSKIIMENCLLRGNMDNPVIKMHNGTIKFKKCTIDGGTSLLTMIGGYSGKLYMQDTLLINQKLNVFRLNGKAVERIFLQNNRYVEPKTFIIAGKNYNSEEYFRVASFDKNSAVISKNEAGKFGAELPEKVTALYRKVIQLQADGNSKVFMKQEAQ